MGGEHFDSKEGKDQKKTKDSYVRFLWPNGISKPLQTVLTKEQLKADPELLAWLELMLGSEKKGDEVCPVCGKEKTSELGVEVRNWTKEGEETTLFFHRACLQPAILAKTDALKMLGKNPTFAPTINCGAALVCRTFKPTAKGSAFNCQHIAVKYEVTTKPARRKGYRTADAKPTLYCKRAHPGETLMQTEANTFKGLATFINMIVSARMYDLKSTVNSIMSTRAKGLKQTLDKTLKDPKLAKSLAVHTKFIHEYLEKELAKS